jgi:xanthine dehydrogenase accessory factor
MLEVFEPIDRLRAGERRVAMATLVATRGTSPKREGAKMWVGEEGRILGSVTIGGCVDARVVEEAEDVLRLTRPRLLTMDLGDEDAWALGLTCAGSVDVLIEPVELDRPDDPTLAAYERVRRHVEVGGRAVVVTPLPEAGAKLVVLDDGTRAGTLGGAAIDEAAAAAAEEVLRRGGSRTLAIHVGEGPARTAFFEVHGPPASLIVFGAGHIAEALVRFASLLGMRTVVVDARPRYANREAFPDADEVIVGIPSEVARKLRFGPSSFVVLVAHDYKFEVPVLKAVLESDAAYIGMLGSRRRGEMVLGLLAEDGVHPEALARVHVPVGLDIGAETAPEFALSILAEALATRAGRRGGRMRDRKGA